MDSDKAIQIVDDMIAKLDDQYLDSVPERHSILQPLKWDNKKSFGERSLT